jgi:tetratricopeptide (TPR) repeat protein
LKIQSREGYQLSQKLCLCRILSQYDTLVVKVLLGLNYMQDSRDYYKILEVSRKATTEEIKKAYRRLAREYHPDLHPNNSAAQERFKEICEAYEVLSDSVQRTQYDQGFDPKSFFGEKEGTSPQDFYVRAAAKALTKDYQGAIEDYTQAIELNSQFAEAYLKRGAIRYKLGDDREALKDCNLALSINPNLAQAYYYQGRARYRLGYTQAAIEAYTQAIAKESDRAEAYYHRGLANEDVQEIALAVEDLQKAAELFSEQGDRTGYRLARDTLKALNGTSGKLKKSSNKNPIAGVSTLLGDTLRTFQSFAFNPGGGLLPSFARLDKRQAVAVGIVFAGIANLCFVSGTYLGWQDLLEDYFPKVSILKLVAVGVVPFVTLALLSAIARLVTRRPGSVAGDIFLAGASLLPVGLVILASSLSTYLPSNTLLVLTVFASCYTILTLYSGCTQISNLSERVAALLVPIVLLTSSWFSYLAFVTLLL